MTYSEVLSKVPPTEEEKEQLKRFERTPVSECDVTDCSECYFKRARKALHLARCGDLGYNNVSGMKTWLVRKWTQEDV